MKWTLEIVEVTSPDLVVARFHKGAQTIEVLAHLRLEQRWAVIHGMHVQGGGRNVLGIRPLLDLVRQVKEWLDVDELRIEGATRTTGAGPGHDPRPLVFR